MLPKIIDWLKEEGCRVTVLTAQPGYKPDLEISRQPFVERRDNLTVIRLSLLPSNWGHGIRYLNYFLFLFAALFIVPVLSIRARKQRRYAMTATMPPVIQPFLFSILSRMTFMKFIYNIQDIHPEIIQDQDGTKTLLGRLLTTMDRAAINNSWRVLTLSEDMKEAITKRGCQTEHIRIINNFPLQPLSKSGSAGDISNRPNRASNPKFIFAGNLGRHQSLPELVSYFAREENQFLKLTILGSGPLEGQLRDIAAGRNAENITFMNFVPPEQVSDILIGHDFGIATLKPGLIRYAFPSKILSYWNAGLPILTNIEADSALAANIKDEKLGANAARQEQFSEAINELVQNKAEYMAGVAAYRKRHPMSHWAQLWRALAAEM